MSVPYYVYVIELDGEEFRPNRRFRDQNPHIWGPDGTGVTENTQFFYVGQSAHEPYCRFKIHKQCFGRDIRYECVCSHGPRIVTTSMSTTYVREHGKWLRKRKFQQYNPIETHEESLRIEEQLAIRIRRQNHAAYFA